MPHESQIHANQTPANQTAANQIRRNDQWLSSWVGNEMMMMSGSSEYFVSLSETAGRIWDLLEQPTTVPALCHALSMEYHADPDEIRSAVYGFLEQMLEEDMLLVGHEASC